MLEGANSSLLYRNYYQLKYSWNFLKKSEVAV